MPATLAQFGARWHLESVSIVGLGIDIEEVPYFDHLANGENPDLLTAYFTPLELDQANDAANRGARLAGRYAAKEAVLKALGIGLTGDIVLTDVEIRVLPSGAPRVVLHGPCANLAADRGALRWLVSISHTDTVTVACAIALTDEALVSTDH